MLRLHPTCISQMEQIARTLINNHHELCELENIYFSQNLNQKDLNKRLKTCKYSSEGAAREWSTVVIVIVIFIS